MPNIAVSAEGVDGTSVSVAELQVDLDEQAVYVRGEPVELTKVQYLLLTLLLRRAGQFVTEDELRDRCLRTKATAASSVRNHVFKLRRRLGHAGLLIRSERGVGYYLVVDAQHVSKR